MQILSEDAYKKTPEEADRMKNSHVRTLRVDSAISEQLLPIFNGRVPSRRADN